MYFPPHRPQLTGVPTAAYDCGVRATQMALNWLSKGKVNRSVVQIRKIMGDQDETNYGDWDRVIDELGGRTEGFSGERTNSWTRTRDHMNSGGAVIVAIHYGTHRRLMQSKSGSLTFTGGHAAMYVGSRTRNDQRQWRSYDSLLDGRYKGCPNGPVWVPQWKVKKAMEGMGAFYSLLLHRDPNVEPTEPGDLLPNAGVNLSDLLSELIDIEQMSTEANVRRELRQSVEGLSAILGVVANPEADANTKVKSGIKV